MNADTWTQALHNASLGNINGGIDPWPAGNLSRPTTIPTPPTSTLTYIYTPNEHSSSSVHFVVTELQTLRQAMTAFESRKRGVSGSWQEWPKGFPNRNEYEGVVGCCVSESEKVVLWVQRVGGDVEGEGKCYLVEMSAQGDMAGGGEMLNEYADGLWGVIELASR